MGVVILWKSGHFDFVNPTITLMLDAGIIFIITYYPLLITMYVILVYDMGEQRVGKMLKLCRKYLHWIQNSVFEGELTALRLRKLRQEAEEIMDVRTDSLIIFEGREAKWLTKTIVGKEKGPIDNFL